MTFIVVANPKGGVGKSTISTNLAGYWAKKGHTVLLGDIDVQQSSRFWLSIRPGDVPSIATWDIHEGNLVPPPAGIDHVILDTPAGLQGEALDSVLKMADKVIIPLQPSLFDIAATQTFFIRLVKEMMMRPGKFKVGVVGMRVDDRTRSADQLRHFLSTHELPVITFLRDTQNYIQLAAHGLTIWDAAPHRVELDMTQWQPLIKWINAKS